MKTIIVIEQPGVRARTALLLGEGPFAIGRSEDCEIFLDSTLVSRKHAVVELSDDVMRVSDVSTNGTMVGDEILTQGSIEAPLDTAIRVASFEIKFSRNAPIVPSVSAVLLTAPPLPSERAQAAFNDRPAFEHTDEILALRREIHRRLLEHLDLAQTDASKLDDPSFRPRVLNALKLIVLGLEARLPANLNRDALIGDMADEALGLGPLEHLLADPRVTEIMVVDAKTIYVEIDGKIKLTNSRFTDDERVRAVIERIITPLGRRIDESSPIVDARLKDGSRVNAIIKPLALKGSCITIRKFTKKPMTAERLIELGTLTRPMVQFLSRSVIVRKNIIISGGTGSGKTTLLNVLSQAIPDDERIVTIEDAAELQLNQPHVVSLETKPPNMEGKGQFTIRDLVKNALRMRPDRIVVGECRGGEALDMLQAMNTGHEGSLTTTHANSPIEAVARLEVMALMAGIDLPQKAIREQLAQSVDLIVQQTRLPDGTRKIVEIAEVVGLNEHGEVTVQPIFKFRRTGTGANAAVLGEFQQTGYLPNFIADFMIANLIQPGEPCL